MGNRDNAFQRLLADEHLFVRFIRRYLRQHMPNVIDVETLMPEDVYREDITFIPPELSKRQSDVLYRIRRGSADVYIYVLIEHQSSVNYLMPFRLLSYMVQFWRRCVEKAGRAAERKDFMLPPVLPVVFYEGEKRWTVSPHFIDKVENARDFGNHVPSFEYLLISLREKTPEEILSIKDALGAMFYLANPAKAENFDEAAERVRLFLRSLSKEERDLTTNHLRGYLKILAEKEGLTVDEALDLCLEREDADIMLAYMQKEFRKARREGREEGREEIVIRLLERGMAISLVSEMTGFPEDRVRELSKRKD